MRVEYFSILVRQGQAVQLMNSWIIIITGLINKQVLQKEEVFLLYLHRTVIAQSLEQANNQSKYDQKQRDNNKLLYNSHLSMNFKSNPKNRRGQLADRISPSIKKNAHLQRVRVIQKNLVLVNGLPSDLSDSKGLKLKKYFGRYGKVEKIVVNQLSNQKKNNTSQVYITYKTEFQAAIAVVALDGLKFHGRPLKVTYGTTKYCSHFLREYQCLNADCVYLHKFCSDLEIQNGDARNVLEDQNDEAFKEVKNNLEEVIEMIIEEEEDKNGDEGFPLLTEMIDFLIDSHYIEKKKVDALFAELQQRNLRKNGKTDGQNLKEKSHQVKNTKSTSFSTVGSPQKSQSSEQSKNQNIQIYTIQQQQKDQKMGECLEETIEKMIIRRLLKGNPKPHSKLSFAIEQKLEQVQSHEIDKMKEIIQKCLITCS